MVTKGKRGRDKLGVWELKMYTTIYQIDIRHTKCVIMKQMSYSD